MPRPTENEKLKELMLILAKKGEGDENFGSTRLNKELWWIDALHYGMTGKTVTGAEYQKLRFGPAPRQGLPAMDALFTEGRAKMVDVGTPAGTRKRLVALDDPDFSLFTQEELDQVDYVTSVLLGATATAVSSHSHNFATWICPDEGQTINMNAIFIDNKSAPTSAELSAALATLAARGYAG